MPIGKSKISDIDFGSFENTIDKNIETDKASDKFDQQLQAYKDAGNTLTSAKSELETAASSLQEAKDNLDKATDKADAVTKGLTRQSPWQGLTKHQRYPIEKERNVPYPTQLASKSLQLGIERFCRCVGSA